MTWRIKTEPVALPVSIADARTHCDYDDTDRDDYFESLVKTAMKTVERWEWRSLITQTIELRLDAFPLDGRILVPRPRLQSVTSVKYIDTDGDTQTLAETGYQVDIYSEPGRIEPAYGEVWPGTRSGTFNTVTIEVEAGYGDDASNIPEDTKSLIKLLIKHFWDNPAAVTDVPLKELVLGVDALIIPCHDASILEFI